MPEKLAECIQARYQREQEIKTAPAIKPLPRVQNQENLREKDISVRQRHNLWHGLHNTLLLNRPPKRNIS